MQALTLFSEYDVISQDSGLETVYAGFQVHLTSGNYYFIVEKVVVKFHRFIKVIDKEMVLLVEGMSN